MTLLLLAFSACMAAWAVIAQLQLNRVRASNRVAFEVIRHWRRMADGSYGAGAEYGRALTVPELAARIQAHPLTDDQQQMLRRHLRARRNARAGR